MCKSCFLFYNKNLLFLFYTINLQKHPHQIIYNTPSFIKIILFHIFFNYSLTHTRPHHLTLLLLNTLSLSFSPSYFYLLLSSSSSSFPFLKKKKEKKIYLPSFHGLIHSHSLSHGDSKLGFWVDLYFAKWIFCCVLF